MLHHKTTTVFWHRQPYVIRGMAKDNTNNYSVPFTKQMLEQSPVARTYKHFPNSPKFFHSSMMPQQILENLPSANDFKQVDNLSKYTNSTQNSCHFLIRGLFLLLCNVTQNKLHTLFIIIIIVHSQRALYK